MKNRRVCRAHPTAIFLLLLGSVAAAEPLYVEQIKQAEISDKVFQKSLKQVKEHKEIKIVDDISVPPFHKRGRVETTKKQAFCTVCHLPLPHRENERSRTFMNMHSRYIACETCHFRPKETTLEYRWLAYDGIDAGSIIAPRRVTEVRVEPPAKPERKHKTQFKKSEPLAPQPGARISPFYNDVPVLLFKNNPFAKKINREWKDADEAQRAKIKARLHAPLKKAGPVCKKCHAKRSPMFDLENLGATPTQLKALQNNIIVRFFDRFKKPHERIRIDKLLR